MATAPRGRRGASADGARRRVPQAERTAAMRARLVDAAIEALLEQGYGRTTAVEVARRAGVTRGAFHHNFESLADLYVEVLETLYARFTASSGEAAAPAKGSRAKPDTPLAGFVQRAWKETSRREFKAVIEIWLAARNDRELAGRLGPAIRRLSSLFDPRGNPELAKKLGRSARSTAFYRLVVEAMIGMALGRAVSPGSEPLAHEKIVVDLLVELAAEV